MFAVIDVTDFIPIPTVVSLGDIASIIQFRSLLMLSVVIGIGVVGAVLCGVSWVYDTKRRKRFILKHHSLQPLYWDLSPSADYLHGSLSGGNAFDPWVGKANSGRQKDGNDGKRIQWLKNLAILRRGGSPHPTPVIMPIPAPSISANNGIAINPSQLKDQNAQDALGNHGIDSNGSVGF